MGLAQPASTLEDRWSQWLLERNRRGMRVMLLLGATLYPGFGVLDYLLAPVTAYLRRAMREPV